jgi:hypothetical protein
MKTVTLLFAGLERSGVTEKLEMKAAYIARHRNDDDDDDACV